MVGRTKGVSNAAVALVFEAVLANENSPINSSITSKAQGYLLGRWHLRNGRQLKSLRWAVYELGGGINTRLCPPLCRPVEGPGSRRYR